ncbi:division abnormally delayed protein [Leptopilina boulardi]|uniref:division abnormally delayed protein n=1 Tax=Leptopilina boulardi TaxID=63433 RepID=UPI0021F69425|nr:division abnormally delayed protein [Leptopilina boulardi]
MFKKFVISIPFLLVIILCLCNNIVGFTRFRRTIKQINDSVFDNCHSVKTFFDSQNITIITLDEPLGNADTICNGQCCNREAEEHLQHQARADFHNLIHHHSRSLQGLLATTADALRETVMALARQSENKTLILFDQVYRSIAVLSRPSIIGLYQAMVDYVSPKNTPDTLQQPLSRDMLQERFTEFFMQLFPIAYHRTVNPSQQDFTSKFKDCLYKTMDEIQPFGDIPKQISRSVAKSLEATRVLVQALTLGKTVLDKTDSVLFSGTSHHQSNCYRALLRMTHCPKCKGISSSVRPCKGFCTNVVRGCLTEPASELDLAWSGYVETVERLVIAVDGVSDPLGLNAEKAVRQLDTRISDAIMHAMENGPALEEKVRKACGRPEFQPMKDFPSSSTTSIIKTGRSSSSMLEQHVNIATNHPQSFSSSHRTSWSTQLHAQLGNFLASVVRSRSFYGTLADNICEEYPDEKCWNGERVGEYVKTVVDSSLLAQKYNPEFTLSASLNSAVVGLSKHGNNNGNTSVLIDQLRHINQVVQSQLSLAPDIGMPLADEAFDGSGSGAGWTLTGRDRDTDDSDNEDEDNAGDDEDGHESSGSGMGPTTLYPTQDVNRNGNGETPKASDSTIISVSVIALATFCISLAA